MTRWLSEDPDIVSWMEGTDPELAYWVDFYMPDREFCDSELVATYQLREAAWAPKSWTWT